MQIGEKVVIRVYLEDKTMKTMAVSFPMTIRELHEQLQKKLKPLDTESFSLYEYDNDTFLRVLPDDEDIQFVLGSWDNAFSKRLVYKAGDNPARNNEPKVKSEEFKSLSKSLNEEQMQEGREDLLNEIDGFDPNEDRSIDEDSSPIHSKYGDSDDVNNEGNKEEQEAREREKLEREEKERREMQKKIQDARERERIEREEAERKQEEKDREEQAERERIEREEEERERIERQQIEKMERERLERERIDKEKIDKLKAKPLPDPVAAANPSPNNNNPTSPGSPNANRLSSRLPPPSKMGVPKLGTASVAAANTEIYSPKGGSKSVRVGGSGASGTGIKPPKPAHVTEALLSNTASTPRSHSTIKSGSSISTNPPGSPTMTPTSPTVTPSNNTSSAPMNIPSKSTPTTAVSNPVPIPTSTPTTAPMSSSPINVSSSPTTTNTVGSGNAVNHNPLAPMSNPLSSSSPTIASPLGLSPLGLPPLSLPPLSLPPLSLPALSLPTLQIPASSPIAPAPAAATAPAVTAAPAATAVPAATAAPEKEEVVLPQLSTGGSSLPPPDF
eukprot:TRINITY_DN108_c0_g2_i4.p1 TRINITY_DN108_c0_g2~~TRINITY_DN108_c0_g2_i4.p1  ORF type:complete len:558 (+),score=178.93 TRINITY_DN108_c0_g2_i4:613-2286(+)